MRLLGLWFLAGMLCLHAQSLSSDKHHALVFENKLVRVYHVTLDPAQATTLHHHGHPYAYLSLEDVQISNEVPGHRPNVVDVTAGEIHASKGGFDLVERNVGSKVADILVVEQMGDSAAFADPIANYKTHESAIAVLFEQPGMRAYATRMSVAGRTEPHPELHDRLILAVTDVQAAQSTGQEQVMIKLKSGEVKWFLKDGNETSLANLGDAACSFITFEFP